MNKASRGINLTAVAVVVVLMAVSALFNTATAELNEEPAAEQINA